uniref:Uncharacterized protein n=1 Tax=Vespula pensylvanica TaxID=30213 RepID=A0A834NZE4_VESPE|nr:hypothetical protein H0235_009942 [Vespula pensylvanica]
MTKSSWFELFAASNEEEWLGCVPNKRRDAGPFFTIEATVQQAATIQRLTIPLAGSISRMREKSNGDWQKEAESVEEEVEEDRSYELEIQRRNELTEDRDEPTAHMLEVANRRIPLSTGPLRRSPPNSPFTLSRQQFMQSFQNELPKTD